MEIKTKYEVGDVVFVIISQNQHSKAKCGSCGNLASLYLYKTHKAEIEPEFDVKYYRGDYRVQYRLSLIISANQKHSIGHEYESEIFKTESEAVYEMMIRNDKALKGRKVVDDKEKT